MKNYSSDLKGKKKLLEFFMLPLKGKNFFDFREKNFWSFEWRYVAIEMGKTSLFSEKKLLEFFLEWRYVLPLRWEKLLCFREKKLLEFFRMAISCH